jgi:hypothetical protein
MVAEWAAGWKSRALAAAAAVVIVVIVAVVVVAVEVAATAWAPTEAVVHQPPEWGCSVLFLSWRC